MGVAENQIDIESNFESNISQIPSWYKFMNKGNQETYNKIDNIIGKYKNKGFHTLEFIYKLRSSQELRIHFSNVNNFSETELISLFNDTFLPIKKVVKDASENTKDAAIKILELRKRESALNSIREYLGGKIKLHDKLLSRCEYLSIEHYGISLEQFSEILTSINYDQQTKGLLKHTIVMSNVENIGKNISINYPDLDRKLWSTKLK